MMKQSAAAWLREPEFVGVTILRPDGWDEANFIESWAEPISYWEFHHRLERSITVRHRDGRTSAVQIPMEEAMRAESSDARYPNRVRSRAELAAGAEHPRRGVPPMRGD
jgi:hypothetical protein